jgi:choice-of-anchor C domain-containing protein
MRIATVCLALLLFPLAGPPAPGEEPGKNLLVNGSFEEGPDVDDFKPLDEDSAEIKGWVVTRGQIDYITTHWQHADGKRSLDLGGSPGFGGVKQTFATRKGQKYRVTFSLAGNPGGTVAEKRLGVKAGEAKEFFTFDTTGKTVQDMGWVQKTWEFTATGAETTLELFNAMTEDPFAGPALDNVSVVAVNG